MKTKLTILVIHPLFVSIFLFTIIFIISAFMLMNCDEGVWHYVGRIWAQNGIPPYISAVENKTPGIFILYAISYKIFGLNLLFVRLLAMLALVSNALIVYKIANKIYSTETAVFAMYIFGLTNMWGMFSGGFIAHTETFMLFFSTFSIWLLISLENRSNKKVIVFFAGILMGMSIAFKQIAIMTAFTGILLCMFYDKNQTFSQRITHAITFVLGIFLITFASILPILLSGGAINDYIDGAWLILLNSGSSANFSNYFDSFLNTIVLSRIALLFSFLLLIFKFKPLLKDKTFLWLLLWFVIDFIGVNASGHYYGHQIKQMMPSLSIIIGILFTELLKNISSKQFFRINTQLWMLLIVILLFLPYGGIRKGLTNFVNRGKKNQDEKLGLWLRNNTSKNENIYILGGFYSNILAYSDRTSASKYVNTIFLTSKKEKTKLLDDLSKNKPRYIVECNFDQEKNLMVGSETLEFIKSNYVVEKESAEFNVLIRKDIRSK